MSRAAPRSLSRWLSWWLAGQTFLGLGAVCAVVYATTHMSLAARQRSALDQQAGVVRHLVGEAASSADLPTLSHKLDDFFIGHGELALRLHTPLDTPSPARPDTATQNAPPLYASAGAARFATGAPAGSDTLTTRQARFDMPAPWAAGGVLQADLQMDTSADAQVLRRLAWTLLACAAVGALLVSAGGFWLVRRAMAPVRQLALQTQQLGAAQWSHRLDGSAQADELQPLVQQFNALLGRLERSYAEMEGFNADVAHELRTPLANLIGECELALKEDAGLARAHDVLGSNLEELHRLAGVVNTMLFLSQAARGALPLRAPVHSLAALAAEVVEFHEAPLQEAGLTVAVTGDAAANVDTALLRQALSNLLANATRFAAPASVITIDIHADTDTDTDSDAVPTAAERVRLTVGNHGDTLAAAHLPRLFDRFYRADPARGHGGLHHGLGLSIVAAVARMHGGHTHATSAAGRTAIGFSVLRWAYAATPPAAQSVTAAG